VRGREEDDDRELGLQPEKLGLQQFGLQPAISLRCLMLL
jgi:hypothetical protein